jgi:hypothetical protein
MNTVVEKSVLMTANAGRLKAQDLEVCLKKTKLSTSEFMDMN